MRPDMVCSGGRDDDMLPRMQLWARRGTRLPVTRSTFAAGVPHASGARAPGGTVVEGALWWRQGGSVARTRGAPWGALTDPLLRGGGRCGLGGPRLALLQGTALVIHTAALELAQQVKEALLVRGRGPRDALGGQGPSASALAQPQCPGSGHQPLRSLDTTEGAAQPRIRSGHSPHLPIISQHP